MVDMVRLMAAAAFASSALATGPARIAQPANGTHVQPGAAFAFAYGSVADYCQSSYNLTVWAFTSKPKSVAQADTWATGRCLGRYGVENYPGNPDPPNPLPDTLTMPDLSVSHGGFGTGETVSNLPVYLTVVEEWSGCDAAPGDRFALAHTTLIYNATD